MAELNPAPLPLAIVRGRDPALQPQLQYSGSLIHREMADEIKVKAPKVWQNGPARREHDFLVEILRLAQNGKNSEDLQTQISLRVQSLRDLENKYDWQTPAAWAIGLFGGFGLGLGLLSESVRDIGFFMFFLCIFHFWEWLYASWFQPEQVSIHCT